MIADIGEPVDVSVVFRRGKIRPVAFEWRNRNYRVSRITGTHREMRGQFLSLHYLVMAGGSDVYELSLTTDGMLWKLNKIHWAEGGDEDGEAGRGREGRRGAGGSPEGRRP